MPEETTSTSHQWPTKLYLDDTSIPRLPPPPLLSSSSHRGHNRSRTTVDIPPLLPSRSPSHSPTRSSTFLPFFGSSRSSSPRRAPASPAEAAEFAVDETTEESIQRKGGLGKVEKLSSWFEGSSQPVNIGLVASPKQDGDIPGANGQVMETMFSGSQESVPSTKEQRPIMSSANSSTSRFSLFTRKSANTQPKSNPDDLVNLDIKSALFPDGSGEEYSPAAFKKLQQNAESVIRLLQATYKDNLAALKKTTSERNVQADELEAEKTRSAHLKLQLTEMSDRAREQEMALVALRTENERLKSNETALKSIRVITDHTPLDRPFTPDLTESSRHRTNRSSDVSFAESVDSASSDMTHADSVFSHTVEGSLAELARSPGTSVGCPSPALKNATVAITPSIQHSPQIEHLKSLTTNIMVAECQKCRGMRPQEAWDVLNVMQPENQALKQRVLELEKVVEEAFDICVWHPES